MHEQAKQSEVIVSTAAVTYRITSSGVVLLFFLTQADTVRGVNWVQAQGDARKTHLRILRGRRLCAHAVQTTRGATEAAGKASEQ